MNTGCVVGNPYLFAIRQSCPSSAKRGHFPPGDLLQAIAAGKSLPEGNGFEILRHDYLCLW
jgi:hypothetical protein